ncbi:DUF7718 family protein [Streptomyces sedi]|uniref:DUF7718 domain-containing protein n=1 Tax=Streptomyces sedi TaxID=555059 RepID=A0A5C4VE31_9ACTN|nr:hypothetical protein [Streptomyces sedi]TNM34133.1 hypothetical protein FH715_00020 [Streptomyces sedi]
MANNGGKGRKLANMGVAPKPPLYSPPTVPPADEVDYAMDLDGENKLYVRLRTYRGRIVDFAIMQRTLLYERWEEIARIDCCGGTIHRHLFSRDGEILLDHDLIRDIPHGEGSWAVVDDGYLPALDELQERWESNLRRWRDGR